MDTIKLPTHVNAERVAALFPIIGAQDGFVEAFVVTTNGDEDVIATTFNVHRYRVGNGVITTWQGEPFTSFPAAIRQARKNAGWG